MRFDRSRVLRLRDKTDFYTYMLTRVITALYYVSTACPHPLGILIVQTMSHFCRLDPVDDALDVVAVCMQGWGADVVQSSVMLLKT